MHAFLVATETPTSNPFEEALEALGGKPLTLNTWIVQWGLSADALCKELKSVSQSRVVVCSTTNDWSYR